MHAYYTSIIVPYFYKESGFNYKHRELFIY